MGCVNGKLPCDFLRMWRTRRLNLQEKIKPDHAVDAVGLALSFIRADANAIEHSSISK